MNNIRYSSLLCIFFIKIYQKTAPKWIRNSCRFTPSCSEYSIIALERHGFIKGSLMSMLRILRCFPPFGGEDWPK